MTSYILSIDPGVSTGIALLAYEDDSVPELVQSWQFKGGAEGLHSWIRSNLWELERLYDGPFIVIAEKFNPRGSGQGFSYTAASLEPLRCEGVLVAHSLPDEYVSPTQQYFAGGKGKADKKKRQHAALRDMGYYVTGSMVDSPDADDTRSAIAHALSYLTRTGHYPTYDLISEWTERNS